MNQYFDIHVLGKKTQINSFYPLVLVKNKIKMKKKGTTIYIKIKIHI